MGIFDILFANSTTAVSSTILTTEFELFPDKKVDLTPVYEVVTTSSVVTSTTQSIYLNVQGKWIIGVVIAACVVLLGVCAAICCYCKRRRVQTQPHVPLSELSVSNISHNVPTTSQMNSGSFSTSRGNLSKPLTPPRPPAPIPPFVGRPENSVVLTISNTASVNRAGTSQVQFRKGWCKNSAGKKE